MKFCFLPRVGCFSIKIIFSFNSCSRVFSPPPPGLGVSLVLCLQVSPNLVVTQSKKLGPIWENVHASRLASRPEGPASVTSAIRMHCQDGSSPAVQDRMQPPTPFGLPRIAWAGPHPLSRPMSPQPSRLNSAPPPPGSPPKPQVGLSVLPVPSVMHPPPRGFWALGQR